MSNPQISSVSPAPHPSLARPTIPSRTAFSGSITSQSHTGRGLLQVGASIAAGAGPAGAALSSGMQALTTRRTGTPDSELGGLWEMQRQSQIFNAEYLALQESIQSENRQFTTLSNLLKAQHDTSKAAIGNIHV